MGDFFICIDILAVVIQDCLRPLCLFRPKMAKRKMGYLTGVVLSEEKLSV